MKKKTTFLAAFFLTFFLASGSMAQVGLNCDSAVVITTLPFQQAGLNTNTTGSPYNDTNVCASAYMNGNDYIFAFTPAYDMNVNITLSNTGQMVGLFVADNCFDDPTANCIASATAAIGNPSLPNVPLTGGVTYYFLVSTNAVLGLNQTTPFDISVTELIQIDAAITSILAPVSGCELGSQTVTAIIENLGIDSLYNFDLTYDFNGTGANTETVTDTILPGGNFTYSFAVPVLFTAYGNYSLTVYPSIAADSVHGNDTVSVIVFNMPVVNSFPFNEDFEAASYDWASYGTSSSWQMGTPANTIIIGAASGANAWKTNLTGNYNDGENSYIEGPCFDFTTLLLPVLDINIWYETGTNDAASIEYSSDGGATWQVIGAMGDPNNWYNSFNGWSGSSSMWINAKSKMANLAGLSEVKFRIHFAGATASAGEGFAFDDFRIYDSPAADLGIIAITAPNSNCGLSNAEQVSVEVYNFGTVSQNAYDLQFSVDGGSYTTEACTLTIAPGDTITYIFTATADLSVIGNHSILAVVDLAGDTISSNDTIGAVVMNTPVIAAFPYLEDFESGNGYWFPGGTNSSWELGTPADSIINHAASGVNAWKTNLIADHNTYETSYVESPCFDFTALIKPVIDLNVWYETTFMGAATLEASVDNGTSWQMVGANGDPDNWYNGTFTTGWNGNSGNYLFAKHLLTGLGGQPSVKFRITFSGGMGGTSEGFAFDDIHIYDTPANDLAIIEISTPNSDCGLGAEAVTVSIVNYGTVQQTNFPVTFSVDGWATSTTETVAATLLPDDTLIYLFTGTADLAAIGTYDIIAATVLTADADNANDTAFKTVDNFMVISTYPYFENFDGANSFWTAGGTSSSWALGTPAKAVINYAASSPNSWVTNLTGSHNANEDSWVEGPCMDFTTISNPYIQLDVWSETTLGLGTVEVSTDFGATWSVIGANGDPFNWYNGNITGGTGWSGSNSAGDWSSSVHKLDGFGGLPEVKLRVHYNGGFFLTSEGLAFDNVQVFECIPPSAGFTYTVNGGEVTFTNASTLATSYLWDFGDGVSTTEQDPIYTYSTGGSYTVTLIASNSCETDTIVQVVSITVGIEESMKDNSLSVHPNPSNGEFLVTVNKLVAENASLIIYDTRGQIVSSKNIGSVKGTCIEKIDLTSVAKGVYCLKFISEKGTSYKRILIQ